jgi:hypothetical protein
MDPVTMAVLALAAGAAAGLKPTAEQAVKDAYAGVKALIQRKFEKVDLTPLELRPDSEAERKSVREYLTDAGAGKDEELMDKVSALIEVLQKKAPEATTAIGIDLKKIKAAHLKAQKVIAEGSCVRVEESEFSGGIELGEVRAGKVDDPKNP